MILVFIASIQCVTLAHAQTSKLHEQSVFDAEQDDAGAPIRRPVEIPTSVLDILRHDPRVLNCEKYKNISVNQIPAKWFIASEIHLDGSAEKDLIVLPRLDLDLKPGNVCLLGANIYPFWVFASRGNRYELVLETNALGLRVLHSQTNGYRDIEGSVATAIVTTVTFKFDGQKYEVYRSRSSPPR